jgi:hypothetical protein
VFNQTIAYRDKEKLVGVFVRFRAPAVDFYKGLNTDGTNATRIQISKQRPQQSHVSYAYP